MGSSNTSFVPDQIRQNPGHIELYSGTKVQWLTYFFGFRGNVFFDLSLILRNRGTSHEMLERDHMEMGHGAVSYDDRSTQHKMVERTSCDREYING